MLVDDKNGVSLRCDKCGSRLTFAANAMQASVRRMPSGWMSVEPASHHCPLCSRAAMAQFHVHR